MRSTRLATRALAVGGPRARSLLIGAARGRGVERPAPARGSVAGAAASPTSRDTPLRGDADRLTPVDDPRAGSDHAQRHRRERLRRDWTDINVAPFVSAEPITTRDELAEAAASDSDVTVGERLTDPRQHVSVGDLAPGQSAPFTLRVPVPTLPITGDPGVYWIGVHALGDDPDGRDTVADGRARTFIPLVPRQLARRGTVPVSVVLPLRERARRAADGSLNGPARWVNLTRPDGRLSRLADFAASAGAAPVTWLLDPAVLDALRTSAAATRRSRSDPRAPATAERTRATPTTRQQPRDRRGVAERPTPSASAAPGRAPRSRRAAHAPVLETSSPRPARDTVLNLGYADPDVAALARRGPSLLRRADDLSRAGCGLRPRRPRRSWPRRSGYFDPDLARRAPAGTRCCSLSDHGDLQQPTLSDLPTGQQLAAQRRAGGHRRARAHRRPRPAGPAAADPGRGRARGDQGRRGPPARSW